MKGGGTSRLGKWDLRMGGEDKARAREGGARAQRGGAGKGRGGEGAEHLHEPACCLGAAGPRACWGGTEVIQHEVVQPTWPEEACEPGARPWDSAPWTR